MKTLLIAAVITGCVLVGWSCGKSEQPSRETPAGAVTESVKEHTITDAEVGSGLEATCPVMKENTFKVTKNTPSLEYKGKVYYFCCSGCPEDFKKDPEKYAVPDKK